MPHKVSLKGENSRQKLFFQTVFTYTYNHYINFKEAADVLAGAGGRALAPIISKFSYFRKNTF